MRQQLYSDLCEEPGDAREDVDALQINQGHPEPW